MTHDPTNGEPRARTKTLGEERADSIRVPSRVELVEQVERLSRELEQALARGDENLAKWQRSAADFANFKRRTDDERRGSAALANAALITRLLAVLDDFDRALANVPEDAHESWLEGIRLVERKLRGVLESEGVTSIDAIGKPFDPNLHEAVVHEETTDHPDNHVIDELQRGYRLRDRVIRPSLVRVANNPKER